MFLFQQVAASVGSNGSVLTLASIKAPKNGYVYIYISNQSNNDVYFDNLQAGIVQGNIAEENHYYAYGLKIATLSSKKLGDIYEGSLKNNYLYQGAYSEMDDDIGWNDFMLRNYDAQIGRWVQQDPYQQFASPYVGMGGDPVNNTDPSGGETLPFQVIKIGGEMSKTAATAITLGEVVIRSVSTVSKTVSTISTVMKIANITAKVFQVANVLNNVFNTVGAGGVNSQSVNSNPTSSNQTDKFKTMDEAAKDWGGKYNDNSIKDGREYGSTIYRYKEKGKTFYSYTTPKKGGGIRAAKPLLAPDGTTAVARIHSHGRSWGENPGVVAADNNFSGTDIDLYDANRVDGYVTTPDGSLKKYNYKTKKVNVINTDMPSDTKYPKLRKNKIDFDKLPKNEPSL